MSEEKENALVVIERTTALDVFKDKSQISAIVEKIRAITDAEPRDASNALGRAAIRSLAMKVKRSKTYLDGIGKELVDDLKELPKTIDASRKLARDQLDALHDEVRKPLTDWEEEQERAEAMKAAAAKAEADRIASVDEAIANIKQAALSVMGKPAATILAVIQQAEQSELDADMFRDRMAEAEEAKAAAIATLKQLAEAATAAENRERIERERIVAEEAAAKERAANEKRILDAQLATGRAEAERKAAEQRAIDAERRQKEAAEQAEIDRKAAEQRAIQQEQARAAAEKAAAEAAEAKRAADVEHRKCVNNGAVDALLQHTGLTLDEARVVVKAIATGKIPNVTIKY